MAPSANRQSSPERLLIDDYEDDIFNDDPFAEADQEESNSQTKKKNEADGLGIAEAVSVNKKQRAPRVKLDETRLLSEKGIITLRKRAKDLKFKGKGHEFSDMARLLSFYQLWLDDLFPKAKFLDALAMVEKAGHKKMLQLMRLKWIDESRPKTSNIEEDDIFGGDEPGSGDVPEERDAAKFPARVAPIFQNSNNQGERPTTPDVPMDDEDLYDATPIAKKTTDRPTNSLFGNGGPANGEPDEEDLDALMAEEDARQSLAKPTSIFGNGPPGRSADKSTPEDDLDALMAEAEQQESRPVKEAPKPSNNSSADDDGMDDLDALIAESEAQGTSSEPKKQDVAPAPTEGADADEEAAMAEMEGLW